jgi:hypothetical protein
MFKGVVDFGKHSDASRTTEKDGEPSVVLISDKSSKSKDSSKEKISGFIFETRRQKTFIVPEETKKERKSIKKQSQENIRDELICEEEFPNYGDED